MYNHKHNIRLKTAEYDVFIVANQTLIRAQDIEPLARSMEDANPVEILQVAVDRIANLTLACSFGAEDMVLVDMLSRIRADIEFFYLDTDVLFPETYALRDAVIEKYAQMRVRRVRPSMTLDEQAESYGSELWKTSPNTCCGIRKVQPLTQVLQDYDGWITGIRRDQAPTRANAQVFEADGTFGLIKVSPLAFWTDEQVWAYIRANGVPYNPLHDQGYPSIGCVHCTRAVTSGEDPRAGRWSGLEKTECGLHEKVCERSEVAYAKSK